MTRLPKTVFAGHASLAFLLVSFGAAQAQDTVFEVETLNRGLAQPVGDLDLSTPQSSMETFLFAVEDGNFADAAHVLNLNDLDPAVQATQGEALAEKLASVIDRKVVISWQQLLERPDSLNAQASSDNPMAGQARKSLLLAVLELDNRGVAVRLNRVKPEDGDAVWVFSRQTVDNIDALYAEYGPSEFEEALPAPLKREAFAGLMWWEVIGLPLVAGIAFLLALFTWRSVTALSERQGSDTVRAILRGVRLPATLIIIALTIWYTTAEVFVVSGAVSAVLEPTIVVLWVSALMILGINVIDAFLARIVSVDLEKLAAPEEEDRRSLATTISALRRAAVMVAFLVGTGLVLTQADIFQTLGFSLLAGAGALTLVLGFAAREVLGNILASMQISLNRSARVGDQLVYDGHLCHVERIHFTFVQLKVWDGTRMVVPVSKFVSDEFINRNIESSLMIRHATLRVANDTDVDALRSEFMDWAKGDDRVGDVADASCVVTGQGEFGLDVRCAVPVPDPTDGWDVECDMREHMMAWLRDVEAASGDDLVPHLGTSRNGADGEKDAAADAADEAA